MPVIPREEFKGRTGQGDWADSLLELDTDFGRLLDLLDQLGIRNNTLVVFAGDNGPEDVLLWRGSPGYWEGSYFAEAVSLPHLHTWVAYHFNEILGSFRASVNREPLIPMGAPLDHVPRARAESGAHAL